MDDQTSAHTSIPVPRDGARAPWATPVLRRLRGREDVALTFTAPGYDGTFGYTTS